MYDHAQRAQHLKRLLTKAVAEALERKRRLGQYAVVARNGKPFRLFSEEWEAKESAK